VTEIENKTETVSVIKDMTPDERKRVLVEGIKKTVVPAFIGAFFALVFFFKFGQAQDVLWFSVFLVVLLLSYYIQRLLYPSIGVRVKEFETKDWLYVEIFTIVFFWVFWTLLLNN
jgi:uncharacterized membrane protein YjfL (UPF0719 family)